MKIEVGSKYECIQCGLSVTSLGNIVEVIEVSKGNQIEFKILENNSIYNCSLTMFDEYFKPINKFTKNDLKAGYVVEFDKGFGIRMVMPREFGLVIEDTLINGYYSIKKMSDDMIVTDSMYKQRIVRVYGYSDLSSTLSISINNRKLLYEYEEPKPKSIYELQEGDTYWFVSNSGNTHKAYYGKSRYYDYRLSVGNVFLTEQEALDSIELNKIRAIMKKYACTDKEWLNDDDYKKYLVEYCDCDVLASGYCCLISSEFNYKTEEIAQKVISEIGKERLLKYYFKVK